MEDPHDFEEVTLKSIITLLIILLIFLFYKLSSKSKPSSPQDISRSLKKADLENDVADDIKDDKVLNPILFKNFKVIKIDEVSHNTRLYKFEIPDFRKLNLPIGRHISVRADIEGVKVTRAYTPTSAPDTCGYFELLVKSYEFGKMSNHFRSLLPGDLVEVRGPIGNFKYFRNMYSKIGLIAGGTGLTPCLQVIRCVLEGPHASGDQTSFVLFFQNRRFEDILLHNELIALESKHHLRLKIFYFLSDSSSKSDWGNGQTSEIAGYISKDMIDTHMSPKDCGLVCVCGPSGFNISIKSKLIESGHDTDKGIYIW